MFHIFTRCLLTGRLSQINRSEKKNASIRIAVYLAWSLLVDDIRADLVLFLDALIDTPQGTKNPKPITSLNFKQILKKDNCQGC